MWRQLLPTNLKRVPQLQMILEIGLLQAKVNLILDQSPRLFHLTMLTVRDSVLRAAQRRTCLLTGFGTDFMLMALIVKRVIMHRILLTVLIKKDMCHSSSPNVVFLSNQLMM